MPYVLLFAAVVYSLNDFEVIRASPRAGYTTIEVKSKNLWNSNTNPPDGADRTRVAQHLEPAFIALQEAVQGELC